MQKSIETIQLKADQIYNKFKSYFAYQVKECFLYRLELLGSLMPIRIYFAF
jgi:hypothetical protein